MQKNLIISGLSVVILIMVLWPSKKPTTPKDENTPNVESQSHTNTSHIPRDTPRYSTPGNNYVCPAPQPYNPQYPVPNPWYVTPQMQPNQMAGQPVYPQQSQLPGTWGYPQQQYYLPNYRFRNPNNNESQYRTETSNSENLATPPPTTYTPPPNWNYPYQQQLTSPMPTEQTPSRYTPPQFQENYFGY